MQKCQRRWTRAITPRKTLENSFELPGLDPVLNELGTAASSDYHNRLPSSSIKKPMTAIKTGSSKLNNKFWIVANPTPTTPSACSRNYASKVLISTVIFLLCRKDWIVSSKAIADSNHWEAYSNNCCAWEMAASPNVAISPPSSNSRVSQNTNTTATQRGMRRAASLIE